jgi:hypothetical protein
VGFKVASFPHGTGEVDVHEPQGIRAQYLALTVLGDRYLLAPVEAYGGSPLFVLVDDHLAVHEFSTGHTL